MIKIIVKCAKCGEVTLFDGDKDATLEIDFVRYVWSFLCPQCRGLNEMSVQPSKKDLAQRQPLPGIRVM